MFLKKYNLKNKTAVVTGAGKGLGKACAIALAEAGVNVIIISRTKKDLQKVSKIIKKYKVKCQSFSCDVTNYSEIKKIINKTRQLFILISNLISKYKDKKSENKLIVENIDNKEDFTEEAVSNRVESGNELIGEDIKKEIGLNDSISRYATARVARPVASQPSCMNSIRSEKGACGSRVW